jgi:hypothetical protein
MLDTTDIATNSSTHPAASARAAQRETPAWSPPGIGVFALCLASSGVCLLLYAVIRPFSSEVGAAGARAFTSSSWLLAHSLAIVGFILLDLGIFGLFLRLQDTPLVGRPVVALSLSWIGVGLTLPYYGAEVFGLHAAGQRTLALGDAGLLKPLTHAIRWEAGISFIIVGLLLLAIGAVIAAVAVWRSECLQRWSAVPLACGLVLYIPQFAAPRAVRVAHGALMLAGCWWLAWANARPLTPPRSPRPMERNSIEASTR